MKKLLEVVNFTDLGEAKEDLICIEDTKENRTILVDYYSLNIEDEERENFINGETDELRDLSRGVRLKTYEEELKKLKKCFNEVQDISPLKSYI